MAGYKQTLIDHGAVALYSFDGDAFDPVTRKLEVPIAQPNYIIDEIGNQNPGILQSDHETYLGYRLGMPSMTALEVTNQYSISFGYYGEQPSHPDNYAKTYLEIPHSSTFSFVDGSFSIGFQMIKEDEVDFINADRVIIWKENVFKVWIDFGASAEYLRFEHPGGTLSVRWDSQFGKNLSNDYLFCAFTWELSDNGNGNYSATARTYLNSIIVGEQSFSYIDNPPSSNSTTPIYVGGDPSSNDIDEDRHTSPCRMDNIAIYDITLTDSEVATQWRKIFPYNEMIENEFPVNYWRLGDLDVLTNEDVFDEMGDLTGEYVGTRNVQYFREQTGPIEIVDSKGVRFDNGGMLAFETKIGNNTYTPQSINDDYTLEFWFRTAQTTQGVMLTLQEALYPFDGWLIMMNTRDRVFNSGYLQFSERQSSAYFNSLTSGHTGDNWHHIAITREGDDVSFYIDAQLQSTQDIPTRSVSAPGQLYFMNCLPGTQPLTGTLSEIARYEYALKQHQLESRYNYQTGYRIRGIVTLLGTPYQAQIRFYDFFTGELVASVQSDPISGEYNQKFRNDSQIIMVVYDANDTSVRYRAYGPITPSEFDDLPVII